MDKMIDRFYSDSVFYPSILLIVSMSVILVSLLP